MQKASREFQVMVKPIGSICNLDCKYCYYLSKRDLYPDSSSFKMNDEVLERYIVQHIEASPTDTVLFSWHGGEPTLLGVDFFRRAIELQRKHAPPGREILNGIQTNGTLLDEEWCRFLAEEKFYVGLSIDGPREVHDFYRVDKNDRATHKQTVQAYRMLRRHGVHVDVLCVVSAKNVQQPLAVYRFFKDLDVRFLQFLPLVGRLPDGRIRPESVPAEAYGQFLNEIFDEWIRHDTGRLVVQNFDEASRPYLGMDHALCIWREECGDVVALEHNGDLYSCDHFVDRGHRLGNIRERTLTEMLDSGAQHEFGRKKADLPRYCRECEFLKLCNGGCPKDRLIDTPEGEPGLNYLCAGLKLFFGHTRPYFRQLAAMQQAGLPIEELSRRLRAEEVRALPKAGRNDPCPCGSGKKYKRCCLAKALAS
jgi:uncharacterized protein